ncbi:unnamed protein product [Trifolium pratense]|uniref:Uncharacterized protein n=1 Tax=Trifolium pratense TaxID=57577 RepID=A0ACB0LE23_TRIPR|nr:unnamed protein product [Trifolium pratense]
MKSNQSSQIGEFLNHNKTCSSHMYEFTQACIAKPGVQIVRCADEDECLELVGDTYGICYC